MKAHETVQCLVCRRVNPISATTCERCNTPLPARTTFEEESTPLPDDDVCMEGFRTSLKIDTGKILFHVLQGDHQISVRNNRREFTIGRSDISGEKPTIDLKNFGGKALGVSREHARIKQGMNGYTLIDMNSSSGTYLNEKQLTPGEEHLIRSGDTMRLGHLLVQIYFTEPEQESILDEMDW